METKIRKIDSCRVCGNKNLTFILSLGEQHVSAFLKTNEEETPKIPLELMLCDIKSDGCGLLQLKHTTPGELMYSTHYWYKSGINQTMRNALADVVGKAVKLVQLSPNDIVLDIGCNDGTLLRSYKMENIRTVGFDPAPNVAKEAEEGTTKIVNDYFNSESFEREFPEEKAKIITAIAMFYDLDDPNKFVSDIANCLDKNGLFIIQQNYLPSMLRQNAFDNIVHEHLEYYSLLSLNNLLKRHNLEVFDVELNDLNGGSFRTYVRFKGCKSIKVFEGAEKRVKDLKEFESKMGLDTKIPYQEFAQRIDNNKKKIVLFIKKEVSKGKKIYLYGASTRGNTLLQYFGLDASLITAAAERSPEKWGLKTVGTLIPIVSEAEARAAKPDYFFVLPWFFLEEFKQREKEFLKSGGKFIIPLPDFRIIGYENLGENK